MASVGLKAKVRSIERGFPWKIINPPITLGAISTSSVQESHWTITQPWDRGALAIQRRLTKDRVVAPAVKPYVDPIGLDLHFASGLDELAVDLLGIECICICKL